MFLWPPACPIILIGYRGTGKTSVARKLAARLGCPMRDSDTEVENRAGMPIAEMFAQHGEAVFRDLEAQVIAEILQEKDQVQSGFFVLATGGGAILRSETRQRLRQAGHVIWLTATPNTILQRIQSDVRSVATRPSLTALSPLEEIIALLQVRNPLYNETAHDVLATDSLSVEEIVETTWDRFSVLTCP